MISTSVCGFTFPSVRATQHLSALASVGRDLFLGWRLLPRLAAQAPTTPIGDFASYWSLSGLSWSGALWLFANRGLSSCVSGISFGDMDFF